MDASLDFLVRQADPRQWRFVDAPAPDPGTLHEGDLLVRVEKFGLSANNVTYAVLGKSDIITPCTARRASTGQRIASAWGEFMRDVDRWVRIVRGEGRDRVGAVYARMVEGECGPEEAHVLSLWDGAFATR